jgi:hypothetical protein
MIFKLIKTGQQYSTFLTQVSPKDYDFINLWTTTLRWGKDINHTSPVGEEVRAGSVIERTRVTGGIYQFEVF